MSEKIEERSVELSELKSGIKLRAGHQVVLVVNGAAGTPRRKAAADDKKAPKPAGGAQGASSAGKAQDAKDPDAKPA
jgi:hypothetical protein